MNITTLSDTDAHGQFDICILRASEVHKQTS